jgi:hypothetical protein
MSEREERVFQGVVRRVADGNHLDDAPRSRLAELRPASPEAVAEAEGIAGRALPGFLERLYLEVGNGGFGPGYGLLGLRDGHRVGGIDALTHLRGGRLILCAWGCAITSELDLADGQVWGSDPNPAPSDIEGEFPQGMTVVDWFEKWLAGTLHQPWLRQDPETGEWRGATEAETTAMLEEAFGPAADE